MSVIALLYLFITWGVTAVIVAVILLIRAAISFQLYGCESVSWSPRTVGRATDPLIMPVRRVL